MLLWKGIHRAKWISPDHTIETQVDDIYINENFGRSMDDIRTKRAADVASDHYLVIN